MAMQQVERPPDERGAAETAIGLTRDQMFEVLSNCRRRYVLYYLRDNTDSNIGDLADTIAAWENDVPVSDVTSSERKRVYTSLQQVHLPKLDELHVVEYDDRSGDVRLGPTSETVDQHLAVLDATDRSWSTVYFGLAGFYGLLLFAASFGAPVISMLPGSYWAAIVALTLALTALIHRLDTKHDGWMFSDGSAEPPE